MRHRRTWFAAVFMLELVSGVCRAQTSRELKPFTEGIILIGAQRLDDSDACSIEVISPMGEKLQSMFRRASGSIHPHARLSRQGDRLAFCYLTNEKEGEVLVIDSQGEAVKIMDGSAAITAWSPDGQQLVGFWNNPQSNALESFLFDLTKHERKTLELDADCIAEDWHPSEYILTTVFMNRRNRMYREVKGDSYPTRQLDLLTADGIRTPITKNPCTDNIWSRFSPNGDHLAHYGRRLEGEKSLEYVVIGTADGSQSKEIFSFTQFGETTGLRWFRPDGPPAWSPDGSTLVWRVSTNAEATSAGEQRELLFMAADGGNPRRLPLAEIGIGWVSAIEWR